MADFEKADYYYYYYYCYYYFYKLLFLLLWLLLVLLCLFYVGLDAVDTRPNDQMYHQISDGPKVSKI